MKSRINLFTNLYQSVLVCMAVSFFACKSGAPNVKGLPKPIKSNCTNIYKEGVRGQVTFIEGNHMPTPDTNYTFPKKEVRRYLGVFAPTPVSKTTNAAGDLTFFSDIKTKCLYLIQTDKKGCFFHPIPAGKYSIMVWEEGQWYSNAFDGDNIINPVTVEKGKVTQFDIQINYKAVY
jgi:hypothetical protein